MSYTKGPWVVRVDETGPEAGTVSVVPHNRSMPVAMLAIPGGSEPEGDVEANARLIAAAPLLHEALQAVVEWAVESEEGSKYAANMRKPIAFEKARVALKAVGEGGRMDGYARDRYLDDCPECGDKTADLEAHLEKFHSQEE